MRDSNELFELCKQVYEATGWKQSPNISQLYEYWDDYDELCVISIEDADDTLVPAYTSDYLLEKLPRSVENNYKPTLTPVVQEDWRAAYDSGDGFVWRSEYADTPLKALLKLTLNLHEEGLL